MGNPEKPPQITKEEVLEKWGLKPFPVGEIYSPLTESAFNKEVGERVSRVRLLERETGFEPATFSLATRYSTTELPPHIWCQDSELNRDLMFFRHVP